MLSIITSTSVRLRSVSQHIAKVASAMGVQTRIYYGVVSTVAVRSGIIVQRVDPLATHSYMLLLRNCARYGVPCIFYATAEGALDVKHVHAWMMEGRYVAVSNYVREKLEQSNILVEDVVHCGVDMEEIAKARENIHIGEEYILNAGIDPSKYVVVATIAPSAPSAGLWWLAKTAKEVAKLDTKVKFLVVTDERGLEHFANVDNVVARPDLDKLDRILELAIIGSSHIYAMPSLAEGFGHKVLETMALGVPVVHADLPPTREFSVGWRVPVVDVVKFVQTRPYHSGIVYEHHLYRVEDFAKTVVEVAEMVRNDDGAVKQYIQKAFAKASELDIRNVYPKLIKKVV